MSWKISAYLISAKIQYRASLIETDNKWFLEKQIGILEWFLKDLACDSEDWSNDAENSVLPSLE